MGKGEFACMHWLNSTQDECPDGDGEIVNQDVQAVPKKRKRRRLRRPAAAELPQDQCVKEGLPLWERIALSHGVSGGLTLSCQMGVFFSNLSSPFQKNSNIGKS